MSCTKGSDSSLTGDDWRSYRETKARVFTLKLCPVVMSCALGIPPFTVIVIINVCTLTCSADKENRELGRGRSCHLVYFRLICVIPLLFNKTSFTLNSSLSAAVLSAKLCITVIRTFCNLYLQKCFSSSCAHLLHINSCFSDSMFKKHF